LVKLCTVEQMSSRILSCTKCITFHLTFDRYGYTHSHRCFFSHDGKVPLGETHSIKFGAEGLPGVPAMLGILASSMLFFRTKDEAEDETNKGDPFTTICAIFFPCQSAQTLSTLVICGYSTSEGGSVAQLWVRIDPSHINSLEKKERKKSLTKGHVKYIGSTVGIQSYP